MSTPNLAIAHLSPTQTGKMTTIDADIDALDGAITDLLGITMTTADYTMSTSAGGEALGHLAYKLTGSIGAARNLIVPAVKKLYIVSNQTTGGYAVTVKTPSGTGIALSDALYHILYCDGTNVLNLVALGAGASAFTALSDVPGSYGSAGSEIVSVNSGASALAFTKRKYKPSGFIKGVFANSQVVDARPVDEAATFPANFAGSQAVLGTAATATTVFVIKQNATQIGTITFAASGTVGTFASTSGLPYTFSIGDILSITAPASADATAAKLGYVLQGTF
jgi:hypothetical protein